MEDKKIQFFLQEQGPDWIRWHNSPLLASHMAEVWERQIRSARFILESLLEIHWECLNHEFLLTITPEVKEFWILGPLQ